MHLQKIAGDILAVEKLAEILTSIKTSEAFDVDMTSS